MMDDSDLQDSKSFDSIELRVLHGPQAGSTLPFEHGEPYVVGTADTCAVLLAGTQLEPEHVTLTADGDGIHIMPMQGRVMTLEREEVSSGQVLPLGTVLRVGRVKITVDRVDAEWPQDEALEEPDPVIASSSIAEDVESAEQGDEAPRAPVRSRPHRPRLSRNALVAVLLGTVTTALMGAAVAAWVKSGNSQLAAQASESQAESPVPTLTSAAPAAGVASAAPEAAAPAQAAASAPAPAMQEAERLAAVTEFAEKRRVPGETELRVEKRGPKALYIVGATPTRESLAALVEAARTELALAGPVQFAVFPRTELAAQFEDRLRVSGIGSKFKVVRREPKLELQAMLTGPEVRTWETLFVDFTRDYGNVLPIAAQVQTERDLIEFQIETVVAGAFPYVLTTAGRRIAPGGVLEGRTLATIRDGELVFSDGSRVRYAN